MYNCIVLHMLGESTKFNSIQFYFQQSTSSQSSFTEIRIKKKIPNKQARGECGHKKLAKK